MRLTTMRWLCTPPCFALVTSFSTYGRRAFALASVVVIAPASEMIRCDARFAIISFWCAGLLPNRAPFFGAGISLLLDAQRKTALVELLDDFFQRLRTEVRDREEVVLELLHQLADRVDARPLEAVARPFRKVELLDRKVEVGRRRGRRRHFAQFQTAGLLGELGDEVDELAQRVAGRRERVARRDRTVGLDFERELVEVRRLLD